MLSEVDQHGQLWSASIGEFDDANIPPFALQCQKFKYNICQSNTSDSGPGNDSFPGIEEVPNKRLVQEQIIENANSCGNANVWMLSMEVFCSKLAEHSLVLWRQCGIKWPYSKNENRSKLATMIKNYIMCLLNIAVHTTFYNIIEEMSALSSDCLVISNYSSLVSSTVHPQFKNILHAANSKMFEFRTILLFLHGILFMLN